MRRGRRVDRLISLLLLAALAVPTYRQAALLSSGSLLLDSSFAVPVQLAAWLLLLCANLGLWHVHLLLCRAPGYSLWRPLARALRRTESWPPGTATAVWLAMGVCLLVAFAETVGRGLRAYVFFTRFCCRARGCSRPRCCSRCSAASRSGGPGYARAEARCSRAGPVRKLADAT